LYKPHLSKGIFAGRWYELKIVGLQKQWTYLNQGCGVVRSRRFLGGVRVGYLTTLGVGVGFFCLTPTPEVQLDIYLHHTPKFRNTVEIVKFLLKVLLKQVSCCAPRFPLILTAKYQEIFESRSRKFWKGRSRIFYLRIRNPDVNLPSIQTSSSAKVFSANGNTNVLMFPLLIIASFVVAKIALFAFHSDVSVSCESFDVAYLKQKSWACLICTFDVAAFIQLNSRVRVTLRFAKHCWEPFGEKIENPDFCTPPKWPVKTFASV